MSMATKCPACNTLFRVTSQQLQARQGQVRCGKCMTVFDGLSQISSTPVQEPAEHATLPVTTREETPAAVAPSAKTVEPPEPVRTPAVPEFTMEPLTGLDAVVAEPNPAVPEVTYPAEAMPSLARAYETEATEEIPEPPRRARWWGIGSALLLFVLAGQLAYFYRTELAANYPALRPMMLRACEAIGCVVPLPQRPKLIGVEASDLQAIDPSRPNVIQLTATLRNHAKFDLGYPALDLVLTNSKDHTLARRIFMPKEYLEPGRDLKAGLAANAEITIRLGLDTGTLGAVGFRLDLLPGPAY